MRRPSRALWKLFVHPHIFQHLAAAFGSLALENAKVNKVNIDAKVPGQRGDSLDDVFVAFTTDTSDRHGGKHT